MTPRELETFLANLIADWENEIVEFKEADDNYSTDKIGKYFSALSNEANLRDQENAWLVFGVQNSTRTVAGTTYRMERDRLQNTKMQIADDTEPSITFRNVYELDSPLGRVVLFEIPSAPKGIPISWKGHYYARAGESLVALGIDKLDEIRRQTLSLDWSAQVLSGSVISDLDPEAIQKAKRAFLEKYSNRFTTEEINAWTDRVFLERAHLTLNRQITRATVVLLGKPESARFLSPYPAQITWKLAGNERAYEHFSLPFLLTSTLLYQKIRNFQMRILPEKSLLAVEIPKYDQKVTMEALHNCIAHQDYTRNGRILVTEYPDRLVFENEGTFMEGSPEEYVSGDKTPRRYRNSFLAQAMSEINMIDTMGYGIHSMNVGQARRYLPLPDYDFNEPNAVKLTLYSTFSDSDYSSTLLNNKNLSLIEIIELDKESKAKIQLQETREETTVKTKVKTKVKMIELLTQKPDITREELSKFLGLTIDGIDWNIRQLKKIGKIKRIGSDKDGYWEVVSGETQV